MSELKGDPFIIAALEHARFRNRNGGDPNLKRPRMIFDFDLNRIRISSEAATA